MRPRRSHRYSCRGGSRRWPERLGPGLLALVLGLVATLGPSLSVLVGTQATASAGITSDRSQLQALKAAIAAAGARAQSLVIASDRIEGELNLLDAHLSSDRARLGRDHRLEAAATARMVKVAIEAYVSNMSAGSPTLAMLAGSADPVTAPEQAVYLAVGNANLDAALGALEKSQARTAAAEKSLRHEVTLEATTLHRLSVSRQSTEASIAADAALLGRVRGNLRALVNAAEATKREAGERAIEQALLAASRAARARASAAHTSPPVAPTTQPSTGSASTSSSGPPATSPPVTTASPSPAPTPPPSPAPAPPPPPTSSAVYLNPLRSIAALTPERVDQGVDYSGYGPIYALGDGVVLNTVNAGWPGGTFIAYQLSDGPAKGLVVYAAEDINPEVQIGETVTPQTVLGQVYEGSDGIETGWADPSALGVTMAYEYNQFSGANSTAFGYNFSQCLESVGAPGGILQNNPPTGSLPASWPQW
jgi:hypothetical protein